GAKVVRVKSGIGPDRSAVVLHGDRGRKSLAGCNDVRKAGADQGGAVADINRGGESLAEPGHAFLNHFPGKSVSARSDRRGGVESEGGVLARVDWRGGEQHAVGSPGGIILRALRAELISV